MYIFIYICPETHAFCSSHTSALMVSVMLLVSMSLCRPRGERVGVGLISGNSGAPSRPAVLAMPGPTCVPWPGSDVLESEPLKHLSLNEDGMSCVCGSFCLFG